MESPDPNPDRKDSRRGSRISLQTLVIASVASAAASFAASRIWGAGTLVSAAATPVIVALVSEFLRRPVQTVAATAKRVPAVPTLPVVRDRARATPEDPTDVREHTEPSTWRPRWRLAIGTGLVAFAIVVAVYTVPDLLAGRSITGNGDPTTFFGGSGTVTKKASPTKTTVTTTTPTTTVTSTESTAKTPKTTTTATPTTNPTTPTNTSTTTTTTTTSTTSTPPTAVTTTPAPVSTTTTPTAPVP